MKNNILWRMIAIVVTVLLSAFIVYTSWPPLLGIDLAGGTSLLYELDMSKLPASSESKASEVAGQVIEVLKKRVDPNGVKNIIWRVVGGKRIQIQMPLASKPIRDAQDALKKANDELAESGIRQSVVMAAIAKHGPEREKALDAIVPPASPEHQQLKELAAASDALEKASADVTAAGGAAKASADLLDKQLTAQKAFETQQLKLQQLNLDMARLQTLLKAAQNPKNPDAKQQLANLPNEYPRQKAQIQRVIDAYAHAEQVSGGGIIDPAELRRLVTAAGVLDFRIAVLPTELSQDERVSAFTSLKDYGPDRQVSVAGTKARWFQIDPNAHDKFQNRATKEWYGSYVISVWATEPYLLCYDDSARALTHSDATKRPWSIRAQAPQANPQSGGIGLPFQLDSVGAAYMGELTGNNVNKPMTILLDDRAMTAPNINSRISDRGEISFGTATPEHPAELIRKEAEQLKQIMDAGSLPATLQKEPISAVEITPDMGADNIQRGLDSAIYAVIAVMIFMLVYYTITGFFADVALLINLLLVLAAMAMINGTFTLPGIAGLVLTLGMAVDANVLINERIREEIHKGASLWMAVKQGYDKVFWTIFDANLTCSLTSIVLIYVGSEEVKGFGVTLLIGLFIHMFTALFVTRTFMMAAIKLNILRAIDDHSLSEYIKEIVTFSWIRNGHYPFMRVITVANIDWIGKRYYFWIVSGVITIAGLVAFFARGEEKYDIEFRGGTQVTFAIKPDNQGKFISIEEIRHRITSLSSLPGLGDLQQARVYGVGKPEDHRFEMQTTVSNPPGDPDYVNRTLLTPLAKKFDDVLNITIPVTMSHLTQTDVSQLMSDGVLFPVKGSTLDKVLTKVEGIPPTDVTNFAGGTAIILDKLDPPQTAAQLTDRIRNQRQSSDSKAPYREFAVIPLTTSAGNPAGGEMNVPLSRAAMVSVDATIPYDENNDTIWMTRVAATEWKEVVQKAMGQQKLFEGVTSFDAVVADQAKQQALVAIVLSLVLIVIYVWIRFGGLRYGIGAILSLSHDAIVALAATVLSGVVYNKVFGGHENFLLLSDFKINLTMIAAYLTIIGYSVNDTIVIFDRVRELRGRSQAPLTGKLINDAINQCFGRTIWTTFTVFIVVLIMYIWGGEGVRGFSFAMLIGVITGAYSTLAIASPMLLATATKAEKTSGPKRENPFLARKEPEEVEPRV